MPFSSTKPKTERLLDFQLTFLEKEYSMCHFIHPIRKIELSIRMDIVPDQIDEWYEMRRELDRKLMQTNLFVYSCWVEKMLNRNIDEDDFEFLKYEYQYSSKITTTRIKELSKELLLHTTTIDAFFKSVKNKFPKRI